MKLTLTETDQVCGAMFVLGARLLLTCEHWRILQDTRGIAHYFRPYETMLQQCYDEDPANLQPQLVHAIVRLDRSCSHFRVSEEIPDYPGFQKTLEICKHRTPLHTLSFNAPTPSMVSTYISIQFAASQRFLPQLIEKFTGADRTTTATQCLCFAINAYFKHNKKQSYYQNTNDLQERTAGLYDTVLTLLDYGADVNQPAVHSLESSWCQYLEYLVWAAQYESQHSAVSSSHWSSLFTIARMFVEHGADTAATITCNIPATSRDQGDSACMFRASAQFILGRWFPIMLPDQNLPQLQGLQQGDETTSCVLYTCRYNMRHWTVLYGGGFIDWHGEMFVNEGQLTDEENRRFGDALVNACKNGGLSAFKWFPHVEGIPPGWFKLCEYIHELVEKYPEYVRPEPKRHELAYNVLSSSEYW